MKAMILFGTVCNFRCPYCLNHAGRTDRRRTCLTTEQLMVAPAVLRAVGESVETLMVCGGEPTVAADRLHLAIAALPRVGTLKLFTNGFDLPALAGLVDTCSTTADRVELRISVHDGIYTAATLPAHLATWEQLAVRPGVDAHYVALVDGQRTAGYVDMLNLLAETVGADRVSCVHVRRGARDRDPRAMVHAALAVRRFGSPQLAAAFRRTVGEDEQANPNRGGPCPMNGHLVIFDEDRVHGVMCAQWAAPYTTPVDVLARMVTQPPAITCAQRGVFCECGLDW